MTVTKSAKQICRRTHHEQTYQEEKAKQQQEIIDNFAAALVELKEALDAAEREYWRKWAEESTRQFAETILRQCERRYGRKEELQQPTT